MWKWSPLPTPACVELVFSRVVRGSKPCFVRLSALSCLESALSGLESDLRPERKDLRSERVDFPPERVDFRPERAWGDEQTEIVAKVLDGQRYPCAAE